MTPIIRPIRPADAVQAGTICYAAFKAIATKHGFPPDFPDAETAISLMHHFISHPGAHGVVAEIDGRVVGSNFMWEDEAVAGLGPLSVDPAVQNSRIGRRLMEAAIERAGALSIGSVRLVHAAYHCGSLSIYARLGFAVREPLSVLQGLPLKLALDGHRVRNMSDADVEAAIALHRRAHGCARPAALREAMEEGTAHVIERDNRITGYTTGIGFLGHTVGETNEDLYALIGAADALPGPGFLVPSRNDALLRWCLEQGLRIVQPMSLMSMGPYQEPKSPFLPSIQY